MRTENKHYLCAGKTGNLIAKSGSLSENILQLITSEEKDTYI
jgi:hypothetical protein